MYERRTAAAEGDFVVFLIGMRINRLREVRAWLPVLRAMPKMIDELLAHPELGLLGASNAWMFGGPATVQYWRSYEQLEAYARSSEQEHLPAWRAFNRRARETDAVGIWHETYRAGDGTWETIYGAMPAVGLLAATGGRALRRGSTSATRVGIRSDDVAPVEPA